MRVCVCVRERVCVYACVGKRERERVCVFIHMYICTCVQERNGNPQKRRKMSTGRGKRGA
jgi:hypothetical protein